MISQRTEDQILEMSKVVGNHDLIFCTEDMVHTDDNRSASLRLVHRWDFYLTMTTAVYHFLYSFRDTAVNGAAYLNEGLRPQWTVADRQWTAQKWTVADRQWTAQRIEFINPVYHFNEQHSPLKAQRVARDITDSANLAALYLGNYDYWVRWGGSSVGTVPVTRHPSTTLVSLAELRVHPILSKYTWTYNLNAALEEIERS